MATLTNTLTVPAPVVGAEEIESLMAALLEQRTDRNNNNAPNIYELAAATGSKQLQRLASCPSDGSGRRVNGICPVLPVGNSNGIDAHQVRSALALIAAAASGVTTPSPAIVSSPTTLTESLESLQLARQRRPLDRSASEPIAPTASSLAAAAFLLDQQSAAGNGLVGINSAAFCRYKTELCRPFEENGTCKYGDKCQFAHGRAELRPIVRHPKYKTDLCRTYHTTGLCPYGPRCHFIHNDEERRLNEVNRTIIEQQRATLLQVQHQQQQEMLASTLLTQQRLQQALRQQQQQQQVEQVIASSLQRSLSLGSGSARPAKADLFRLPAAAPIGLLGNVSGSIDSGMSSAEAPSSPTSSLATSPTMSSGSSSVSEVETNSIPFQTKQSAMMTDVRQHRKQQRHVISGSASSSSPVAPMQGVPEVLSTDLHPPVNRPQHKPLSNETAISATLLTRRLRDAATNPTASDVELKFNQLLAAAARNNGCVPNASTAGSLDIASTTSLPDICSGDVMTAGSVGVNGYPRWQGATRYSSSTPL